MGPLCRRHHNLKTHYGWTLTPDIADHTPTPTSDPPPDPPDPDAQPGAQPDDEPPGWTWHTPSGFTITDQPEPPLD